MTFTQWLLMVYAYSVIYSMFHIWRMNKTESDRLYKGWGAMSDSPLYLTQEQFIIATLFVFSLPIVSFVGCYLSFKADIHVIKHLFYASDN